MTDTRPLQLAPSYDMLPMILRPASTGEIVARNISIALPTPALSHGFRAIAKAQWARLDAAMKRFH